MGMMKVIYYNDKT